MINEEQAKRYCCEDISLIENYEEAVNSGEKYDVHHKLGLWFNKQWLIDNGFYYKQRAEMLMFMKHSEHMTLHWSDNKYTLGRTHSEESKQKISKAKMGHSVSEEAKQKMSDAKRGKHNTHMSKKVHQYTLDGHFVSEYPSGAEAGRKYNISGYLITACCRGEQKTAHGFVWRFVE